jgi:alpha-1,2-mannosyltransferase
VDDTSTTGPMGRVRGLSTRSIALAASLLWLGVGGYTLRWGRTWDLDLRVYRGAGRALLHGGNPYLLSFTGQHLAFTYPPFALMVLTPLAWGPLWLVETLWWIVSASSLVAVLALALRHTTALRGPRAVAVAGVLGALSALIFEPLRSNMDYGQINWILMLLIVVDLTTLTGRWRGTLVGVAAAVKLTPLVFLGYFLVQRQWRPLVRGALVFLGLSLAGCVVLQIFSLHFWLDLLFKRGNIGPTAYVGNQSWLGLLSRSPFHGGAWALVLWIPLTLGTLAAGLLLTRRLLASDRVVAAIVALAFTELLVSPISWTHHWSWLVLVPLIVASEWRRNRTVGAFMAGVLALAVVAPYWWLRSTWIADDSLVLAAGALLFFWAASEWRSPAVGRR